MTEETSVLALVLRASPLVQAVLLVLLAASVFSWATIIAKWREFRALREAVSFFEKRFWSGVDLEQLYRSLEAGNHIPGSVEEVFVSGYREFRHLYESPGVGILVALDSAQRGIRAGLNRTVDAMEQQIGLLATIGSISPYVGLFGTVWGIMNAFQGLASAKQATLAMVAPGIAEALIATALGLFAAIPAVIAYNRFSQQIDHFTSRYESFSEEFMGILQRQANRDRSDPDTSKIRTARGV